MITLRKALLAAAATVMSATAAQAQVTLTFNEGTGGLGAGEVSLATFDGDATTYGGVVGGVVMTGSNGNGADPAVGGQGDPYLSVLGGQTADFDFSGFSGGGLSQLGLDFGSADTYNLFTLFLTGAMVSSVQFTGQDIINAGNIADGNQTAGRTNGRLTFFADAGATITGLRLQSDANSLETDNYGVIASVPEPATWGMMLLGFGGIGAAMRRSRRSKSDARLQIA
ncbi:PEP-CTERM sorting domain-containing protein [Sphingomonas piscis]|uniref:PEP-CTERM sorting domain-containing protein n=1 Tax=Sphingomonas piscis TaxID=2714943 RepID=A0A6G7YQT1_9SPHN|nr:PEPxxWA-CTERM sorting domain-containing protein [Sphingomonas piscis]QIK79100.1 PEP-CTERM sorting domain-containing protein [Sphingomonas piscis]